MAVFAIFKATVRFPSSSRLFLILVYHINLLLFISICLMLIAHADAYFLLLGELLIFLLLHHLPWQIILNINFSTFVLGGCAGWDAIGWDPNGKRFCCLWSSPLQASSWGFSSIKGQKEAQTSSAFHITAFLWSLPFFVQGSPFVVYSNSWRLFLKYMWGSCTSLTLYREHLQTAFLLFVNCICS